MVDITDRFFRHFMRYLTPNAVLYTEMLNEHAIIHTKSRHSLLAFSPGQNPVVCQIGGNDPEKMALAAKIAAEDYGYDEINVNCGCPSNRTRDGCFGAVHMFKP